MLSDRSRGQVLAVALAVVLASLLVPGVVAQQVGQPEGEPNDTPQNATAVQPGTTVSGEITRSANASEADADWFAVPVQAGQTVTVTFEGANESERLLVFLADPSRVETSQNASSNASDAVADIDTTMGADSVTLNATAERSGVYFLGVTGLSGEYEFTVEMSGATAMGENGTNATANGTDTVNGTAMANASGTTPTTTSTQTTQTTTESTTTASTSASGGDGGESGSGGNASGEGTSASGPGFGPLAALVALLAAALLVARRR